MTSTIAFDELSISPARIDVRASTGHETYNLWFEFSEDVPVSTSSVAVALSTLCGRKYQRIEYKFPVSAKVMPRIRELTFAEIETRSEVPYTEVKRRGNLLSFSGGFDSMSALSLMPAETQLVSMDFGGRFAREREFFKKFDTLTVSTNVVDTPLRLNSWSFMGIGAILAADYFGARYHTFGGILEAGPDNMRVSPVAARNSTFPPFQAAGYVNAAYVLGLTEVGTLTAMLSNAPQHVAESLLSVASPGEEKLYRKAVLASVVSQQLGVSLGLPQIEPPAKPHFQFGQNFAIDLLALYVMSATGDREAYGMIREIPDHAVRLAEQNSFAFMGKANPTLYENFPTELSPGLYAKFAEAGISWYTEKDWREFQETRELLAQYHPAVAS